MFSNCLYAVIRTAVCSCVFCDHSVCHLTAARANWSLNGRVVCVNVGADVAVHVLCNIATLNTDSGSAPAANRGAGRTPDAGQFFFF